MMGMILQVGAVPMGFTSEVESHCCDQCCDKERRYFFSSTMDCQCLRNESPLPDLIPGNTPSSSPNQQGFPLKTFFPMRSSSLQQNLDSFPPTPSPTPLGDKCPKCRNQPGKEAEEHSMPKTSPDWSPEKVQLKLEHIQSIKQRLEEDVRSHFFYQSYIQRQQNLPQLSWGIPPSRRSNTRQQLADQHSNQRSEQQLIASTSAGVRNAPQSAHERSGAWRSIEHTDRSFEWRVMGEELRLVADTFQMNHASTSSRTSVVLPSAIPYALAASLFFFISCRLISRWR
ncbi:uncharacterized protein [Palaemon carinicauda]|uniref:uncharacterized protein n=1 Tax=Palaemon carinicauda TaxID=392227 RepID=UPI0035B63B85